ncbi:hypothetical protein AALC25_14245 [Lachnospiraceae bacterium 29-84]
MKRRKEVFWGVLMVLGAISLLVNRMGMFPHISIIRVLFTIFLLGMLVENLVYKSFGGILFSLAFLGILYDRFLGIENLTPIPILLAALLGTIGLNLIFKKKSYFEITKKDWAEKGELMEAEEDGRVECSISFGSTTKYIDSRQFQSADLVSTFGSMIVYFDQVVMAGDRAEVHVDISFGNIELYIPGNWKAILDVDTSFGDVEEKGNYRVAKGEDTLYVTGNVSFGGLEIHYI